MLYQWRAVAYATSGKSELAIADWRRILSKPPKAAYEYNNDAWILATCPLAKVRNGKQAIEFATQSCKLSGWKDAENLDTLAAAYAKQGDFTDAIAWEKKALATLAPSEKRLAPEMRDRLALYQMGRPYRASYPTLFSH
jgi:tetratricopeptide (TPR) repeat protein